MSAKRPRPRCPCCGAHETHWVWCSLDGKVKRMGKWDELTARLTHSIQLNTGWKVLTDQFSETLQGQIDYDRRTIKLFQVKGKERFLTLVHEEGHRQAFAAFNVPDEFNFRIHCPDTSFREYQACVYGWRELRRLTNEVTMAEWLDFSSDLLKLREEYGKQ